MNDNYKVLKEDGVVLTKDFFNEKEISAVREEYDQLDKSLTNKEIYKEKPIIVFWKHVKGEQKRIATFDEFPAMWNLINTKIVPFIKESTNTKDKIVFVHLISFCKSLLYTYTLLGE